MDSGDENMNTFQGATIRPMTLGTIWKQKRIWMRKEGRLTEEWPWDGWRGRTQS